MFTKNNKKSQIGSTTQKRPRIRKLTFSTNGGIGVDRTMGEGLGVTRTVGGRDLGLVLKVGG